MQIDMEEKLEQYILDHIDREPALLKRLERDVNVYLMYPRMCSGHLQGRILKMLTAMIAPRLVLEVGTYAGYSALCIAEALQDDAMLHTVEIDDEMEDFIRERFDASAHGHKITLHIGDAAEVVPTLEGDFDMVYMDANKRTYVDTYEAILPRVRKGGFILADNTLWSGKVADEGAHIDPQTRGILDFNDHIAADERVEKVILPLRDGLTLIRKK